MEYAMLWLGLIIGCPAGFMFAWWFAGKVPPLESFFGRILKLEKKSVHLNSSLALYELQTKVDDLLTKVGQIDLNLQELLDGSPGNQALKKDLEKPGRVDNLSTDLNAYDNEEGSGRMERCRNVERLYQQGLNTAEIAQKLKMGKGEVELVLSLGKKPLWGNGIKNDFKKGE